MNDVGASGIIVGCIKVCGAAGGGWGTRNESAEEALVEAAQKAARGA